MTSPGPIRPSIERRYLDLLKGALLNETGLEAEAAFFLARKAASEDAPWDDAIAFDIPQRGARVLAALKVARGQGTFHAYDTKEIGFAKTMVGRRRLDQLENAVNDLIDRGVAGDLVECGVWRGGASILMRGVLETRGERDRKVWLCDSFAGLPAPGELDAEDLTPEARPELVVSRQRVEENFDQFDLLDDQVRFVEGFFRDTLPGAPIDEIALLRLDGDYYDSTIDSLEALYDRVSPGGIVIVDDYAVPGCREATNEFRSRRAIEEDLVEIDWTGRYWRVAGG